MTRKKPYRKLFLKNLVIDFKERPLITIAAFSIMALLSPFVLVAYIWGLINPAKTKK